MLAIQNIVALRMERQFLTRKANQAEYDALYRDTQPGQNVYWHGFGAPPSITFRADFDDIIYNRRRQKDRLLVKGRFQGGNLGWVLKEDLALFAGVARKPLRGLTPQQETLLELIEREGPLNIQLMKELTGMLVKEITPVLHRLQEAFLIYEDQYDGEWDRGWYQFSEMFPEVNLDTYTRQEALKILLQRFAYRHVLFDTKMAKSFYKLPEKDIKAAVSELVEEGVLNEVSGGYMLKSDVALLENNSFTIEPSIFVLHRNDFLVKSNEHWLKETYKDGENDILQYLLIDGEFHGAVLGKFKYGPYILENVVTDIPGRKEEIINAVYEINGRENPIKRFNGELQKSLSDI